MVSEIAPGRRNRVEKPNKELLILVFQRFRNFTIEATPTCTKMAASENYEIRLHTIMFRKSRLLPQSPIKCRTLLLHDLGAWANSVTRARVLLPGAYRVPGETVAALR